MRYVLRLFYSLFLAKAFFYLQEPFFKALRKTAVHARLFKCFCLAMYPKPVVRAARYFNFLKRKLLLLFIAYFNGLAICVNSLFLHARPGSALIT